MDKTQFITELKAQSVGYLRIDEPQKDSIEDRELSILADGAASYIEGAIGEKTPWEDKRVMYIGLITMSDMYDKRETSSDTFEESYNEFRNSQQINAAGRLIRNFIMQIKAEIRDV